MSIVKVALIGIGGYGAFYASQLVTASIEHNVELVAGIDPYPERSPALSALRAENIPIFTSLDEFYRQNWADLVVIAAPIHLHAPLTVHALEHGSNVLCEKPLCAVLDDADRMEEAEQRFGKFVAIGYQWSFSNTIQTIKRDILAGEFGRPLQFKTLILWPRPQTYYQRNSWAGRIKSDNGAWVFDSPVSNATAHYLHNMLYLLGNSRETSTRASDIQAVLSRANSIENFDAAALRIVTEDDVELLMFTAHPVRDELGPLASYRFENASLEYDRNHHFVAHFKDGSVKDYGSPNDYQADKLWQAVDAVRTVGTLACGNRAARPHVEVVNRLCSEPIYTYLDGEIMVEERGGDRLIWVPGLGERFKQAYDIGQLLPLD